MFKVTTTNLSEDLSSAHRDHGSREIGLVPGNRLHEILDAFSRIDPVQNHEAAPQIAIATDAGRFMVRTSETRLFLYDLDNASAGASEHTADEIVTLLGPVTAEPGVGEDQQPPARRLRRIQPWIALAMLVVGLALNGFTLYSAFYIDNVNVPPPLAPIANKTEFARIRNNLVGTFTTGSRPGDRGIVIRPDGTASLVLYGAQATVSSQIPCSYTLGRRDKKLYINLSPRGLIEVSNPDLLTLFGDTYNRAR